ncbi:MAG: S-layer homology domain-containing protein, partial [Firmicutes bacterium]|nr:S-layer homology domain-containing protein [Bacillota bacterium]
MKKKSTLILLVMLLVLAFAMPVSAASFTDVKDSDWFAPFVYDLSDQSILSGYPDGTFRPQNTVTRGEFVKILAFASKDDLSAYGKNLPFADSKNHWSKANIDWAYQNGIVNGKSSTSFDPDGKITRQEMAVMIYRYADYKNIALPKKADPIAFSDSNDISNWAKDAVSAMQQSQIISGYPDKTFKPTNNANRGEAAKMISVYIDLSKSEEEKREEFLAKDVNDFDADKVINFDNSNTENFGVVLDEVEIIKDDKKTNQVLSKNEETGVYVFGNINDEIKSLKPGDKFVIPGSDPENSVAIVVETITINGTNATIKSKGGEIGDFYQYIQIDMEMEPEAGHIEVVNSDFSYAGSEILSESFQPLSEDGVTPSLKVKETFKVEHSFNANIHSSNLEVGGTIELSLKVKPVIEYDFELFGKDYVRFDMTTEISNTNKVSIEIKEKPESEFGEIYKDEMIEIDIPVATGVNVVGGINFIINADGKISAEFESESKKTSGFKFNTKDGYREIDESESKDSSFKLGMEGKLEAGVEAKFGVEIIEIVEASLNTGVGAGVKLSASIVDTSKVHNCYLCLDGNAYRFVEAKFKVELGVGKSKITPVDVTLTRAEHEFGKCYCSLLNENGELKFGWGECPNIKQKTEDEDGDNTGGGDNKPPVEDDPVEDEPEPELGEIIDSGQCGDNVYWKLDDQGTLQIYGTGSMFD